MSVYVVGLLRARNWTWYRDYVATTAPLIARHGGKYLLRGLGVDMLEGNITTCPSAVVVLEFPSEVHARAWHDDPDYRPMIELRRTGCDTDLVLAASAESP